jgi:hypothetical protein
LFAGLGYRKAESFEADPKIAEIAAAYSFDAGVSEAPANQSLHPTAAAFRFFGALRLTSGRRG